MSSRSSEGVLGIACVVRQAVLHVNSMRNTIRNIETEVETGFDRHPDPALSTACDEAASEETFEAAAGSAPLNQDVGESTDARWDDRATASAAPRPPPPNDRRGWPEISYGGDSQ